MAILAALTGCSSDPVPIESQGPYLCGVLPRSAPLLMFPEWERSRENIIAGSFDGKEFYCSDRPEPANSFDYAHLSGPDVTEGNRTRLPWSVKPDSEDAQVADVPRRIGSGSSFTEGVNIWGWVHWQCGEQKVLSALRKNGTAEPAEDRDLVQDMIRLLEIAQDRYAKLNDCEPRRPG